MDSRHKPGSVRRLYARGKSPATTRNGRTAGLEIPGLLTRRMEVT